MRCAPLVLLSALLATAPAGAQVVLTPTVIATAGGTLAGGGVRLDQTIGEPLYTSVSAAHMRLDQGFQQSEPLRLRVDLRAFLEGPYRSGTGRMIDSLRTAGYLPMTEPYTALGFTQVGGGGEHTTSSVLAVAGDDAVVDWIVLELRDAADSTLVVATRCALLQRDGDVMDVDGSAAVAFAAPPGPYHLCVKHRNHLAVLTLNPITLGGTAIAVDLTDGSTATFGTEAQKAIGAVRLLWAGDVNGDGVVKYTGTHNDRDLILSAIGGVVPTNTAPGYAVSDVDLDGRSKYTGAGNDREPILQNIGGVVPTNTRAAQLP